MLKHRHEAKLMPTNPRKAFGGHSRSL